MEYSDLKRTALFSKHQLSEARFAQFSGWYMPLHYGSQIEEHKSVRKNVGIFDVSHMCCLDVRGESSESFLRYVFSNDITSLDGYGRAMYGCLLNDQGGIIDDLIVYRMRKDWIRMVVNAGRSEYDLKWLQDKNESFRCDIVKSSELSILSIQGPNCVSLLSKCENSFLTNSSSSLSAFSCEFDENSNYFIARTGYTGEDGFELIVPNDDALLIWDKCTENGASLCGLGARDTLRLEAGLNLYGHEMDDTITPSECGIGWAVNTKDPERRFVGRDALKNHEPRFKRIGVVLTEHGVLRQNQKLTGEYGDGVLTSGGFSPTMGKGVGMARIPRGFTAGQSVEISVRGKQVTAKLCALPFVRKGKILAMV